MSLHPHTDTACQVWAHTRTPQVRLSRAERQLRAPAALRTHRLLKAGLGVTTALPGRSWPQP